MAGQPGEYAVFHERPFPKRLDRAFRVGAIAVALLAAISGAWIILAIAPRIPEGLAGPAAVSGAALLFAALAYGFTRAVGMIVVGIYGSLQKKQYVVDWDDGRDR